MSFSISFEKSSKYYFVIIFNKYVSSIDFLFKILRLYSYFIFSYTKFFLDCIFNIYFICFVYVL